MVCQFAPLDPPTSCWYSPTCTPGTRMPRFWNDRPVGSSARTSVVSDCVCVTVSTSISGLSPVTVMVSSTPPTVIWTSTLAEKVAVSVMPSRTTMVKPGRVNVTVYSPGLSAMMRYAPALSVNTTRDCSMSAGLDASTVTPGRMPPVLSVTMPAISASWARTADGTERKVTTTAGANARTNRRALITASSRVSDVTSRRCRPVRRAVPPSLLERRPGLRSTTREPCPGAAA